MSPPSSLTLSERLIMCGGRAYCTACEREAVLILFLLVADYLRGHTVGLVGKHAVTKNATRGCSQGSILLGPSLWNLVFDDLLHTLGRRGVRAVAYTDDLLIIISGNSRVQIETAGQTAIGIIEE